MKTIPHRHHAAGKRKIRQRLDRPIAAPSPEPVFAASNIHYEAATKTRAIACGGMPLPLRARSDRWSVIAGMMVAALTAGFRVSPRLVVRRQEVLRGLGRRRSLAPSATACAPKGQNPGR